MTFEFRSFESEIPRVLDGWMDVPNCCESTTDRVFLDNWTGRDNSLNLSPLFHEDQKLLKQNGVSKKYVRSCHLPPQTTPCSIDGLLNYGSKVHFSSCYGVVRKWMDKWFFLLFSSFLLKTLDRWLLDRQTDQIHSSGNFFSGRLFRRKYHRSIDKRTMSSDFDGRVLT